MELRHIGYGAAFNTLYISEDGTTLIKRSRTPYGHAKLLQEISFYEFLQSAATISFPVPRLLHIDVSVPEYSMEYIQCAQTLGSVFPTLSLDARYAMVDVVRAHLQSLHEATRIEIPFSKLQECVHAECFTKLHKRYADIATVIEPYVGGIEYVNGLRIPSLPDAVNRVYTRLMDLYTCGSESMLTCAIHGDAHFNNILVRPNGDLIFLDPRGNFGDISLYGPAAYDFAKVRFSLTGYSVFDAMEEKDVPLEIVGTVATLGDLFQLPRHHVLTDAADLETLYTLTIWLGNAHCFASAPRKAAFSALYARWLVALVLGTLE